MGGGSGFWGILGGGGGVLQHFSSEGFRRSDVEKWLYREAAMVALWGGAMNMALMLTPVVEAELEEAHGWNYTLLKQPSTAKHC